jgi:4'-phosphopantetheinyl transferase
MKAAFSIDPSGSEIHIWTLPIQASSRVVATLERVLTTDETDRASRFHFSHLSEAFVIARGALRYLLGRYLNRNPAELRFTYGDRGKPTLAPPPGIRFNLTHSGNLAVIALTTGLEIGVDVEQIRPLPDMQSIADRSFCPEEASEIMSLPQPERDHAFYRCWTRKEAYIKAIGDGLSAPLDDFRVTVQPNTPARFVHIEHDASAAQRWTLHDLQVAAGYAAALAYHDQPRSLSMFPITDFADLIAIP